jgi:hypothetical protein
MHCILRVVTTGKNVKASTESLYAKAYVKGIVLSHLSLELISYPRVHMRSLVFIQPAQSLNFANDPSLLALFGKDPTKSAVVCSSAEDKITSEKYSGRSPRK